MHFLFGPSKTFSLVEIISSILLLTLLHLVASIPKGYEVFPGRPIDFKIRFPLPEGPKSYRAIFGKKNCNVAISCDIDIPKLTEECSSHYVKVTDGSSGFKKFCGKVSFSKIRASEGLRHLFLVVKSDEGTEETPMALVDCSAECVKDNVGEKLEAGTVTRKTDSRCVCGLQNKDDRIVGGEDAIANEFPWQAAIVYPNTRSPYCGASVINNQFILTAAHCFVFDQKQPKDMEVLVHASLLDMTKKRSWKDVELGKKGSIRSSGYNLSRKTDAEEKTLRLKVAEIINHPLFNDEYDFDYALLKLEKKLDFGASDSPTPICLPAPEKFDQEMANWKGQMVTVTGWGLAAENAGGTTRALQKLEVPYMEYSECSKANPGLFTDRMICAGYKEGKKDACSGDSGGPLAKKIKETKQYKQVGIVSWGIGCARPNNPGYYSRVTEMVQWIHLHTTENDAKWCSEQA